MNTTKNARWLCLFLCVVMVFSMVPVAALANTAGEATSNAVPYYGRTALAALSNSTALLYAYDQLATGVEATAETITVYDGTNPITQAEIETVMDAYRRDYAHHFWIGNSYQIASTSISVVHILPSYTMTGANLETAKAALEQEVTEILSGMSATMSEYEKVLYLHDKLAEIITAEDSTQAHNAYGALVEGKAVCEGYAEALQYLLHRCGIQSFLALGTSLNPTTNAMENHEWNYVKIDGNFYHVDLTWDDQGDDLFHAYLNQTDAVILEDHALTPVAYALPSCTATTAQYFTGKDTCLSAYTTDSVGQLLKDNGMSLHVYVPGSVSDFIFWYQTNIGTIGTKAGVTGSFSYGYSRMGRELILRLMVSCAHTDLTLQPATEPTATASGHKAYYKCSCGQFFEDADATVAITDFVAWKEGAGKLLYEQPSNGICGEDLTWSFEGGRLTISGTGAMSAGTAPWYGYADSIHTVVLASGVTSLAQGAFENCDNLQTVYYSGNQEKAQQITGNTAAANPELAAATWHYQTLLAGDDLTAVLQSAGSGTQVILTKDLTLRSAVVRNGVILDLNGNTLATDYFTCYGNVIDCTVGGNGLLKAAQGIHIAGTDSYLPIYDSAAGGYRLYKYALQNLGYKAVDSNTCKLGIRLSLSNPAGYTVLAGTTDKAVDAIAYISWGNASHRYVFSDNTLRNYAAQTAADIAANGTSTKAITLIISGLEVLSEGDVLSAHPAVVTAPGVTASADTANWSAQ